MSRKNGSKPRQTKHFLKPKIARRLPVVQTDKKTGNTTLMCPFCDPTHPISTTAEAGCGTILHVEAVQTTYRGRTMPCAVCGEIGGQMVKLGEDSYRHASNCAPGVQYYDPRTKHKFSNAAKLFHKSSPEWLTLWVSDKMGYTSEEMATVGADGKRNEGEIVGYTWRKTK